MEASAAAEATEQEMALEEDMLANPAEPAERSDGASGRHCPALEVVDVHRSV